MHRRRSRPQLRQDQSPQYSPDKQSKQRQHSSPGQLRRHGRSFSDVMSEISGKIRACRQRTCSEALAGPFATLGLERDQQMARYADADAQQHVMSAPVSDFPTSLKLLSILMRLFLMQMQYDPGGCTHYGTDGIVYHVDLVTHTMTPVGYHPVSQAQDDIYHTVAPAHPYYQEQPAQLDGRPHDCPDQDQPYLEPAYAPGAADQHLEQHDGGSDTSFDLPFSDPANATPQRSATRRREPRKRGGRGKGNTRQRTNSWVQQERESTAAKDRQKHVVNLTRHAEAREMRRAPFSAKEPLQVEGACEIQGTVFYPIHRHPASQQRQQQATPSPGTPPAAPPAAPAWKPTPAAQPPREQDLEQKLAGVRGGLFSSLMTNESYDWSRHGALSEGESVDSSVEIIINAI